MKNITSVLTATILLTWLAANHAAAHAGDAAPAYQVIRQDGQFELRDYPALILAETPTQGRDNSFMKLFHFFGGENTAKKKITMTTPVLICRTGSTNTTIAFVLPASLGTNSLPQPTDADVTLKSIPAGRFAVLRYSGGNNLKNSTNAAARLTTWLAQEKIPRAEEPVFAYFDPPWTLPFLRHNEVMIRLTQP